MTVDAPQDASGKTAIPDYLLDLFDDIHCESMSFSSARYVAPWHVQFPGQDETCGHLLEEGTALLEVAGGIRLDLEAGDLALVTQGHPHRLSSRDDKTAASLGHAIYRLDRARAAPLLKMLPPALVLKGQNGQMSRWVQPLATLILDLKDSRDVGGMAILRRIAEASLIRAAQEYLQSQLAVDPNLLGTDFYRIAPVLHAMNRRPGANWSVASLAREAGMSRTVFSTLFTQKMGESPGHYLTKVRMSTARDLLRSDNLSLAEIAMRVGYRTEMAFSRAFKRHYGVRPTSFRRAELQP